MKERVNLFKMYSIIRKELFDSVKCVKKVNKAYNRNEIVKNPAGAI